jgi:hypothetical protein
MPMGSTTDGSGWLPSVPQRDGLDCIGKSRIAIPLCKSFMTLETPICRTPTFWDLSPRVLADGRLRSYREIADRDFLLHNFLTIENSDEQNADGARSFATCPRRRTARIDSRGFGTYDVLVLMASRTPISRSPTFVRSLTPVPCERTAQILSVNRGSRLPIATVLHS